MPRVDLPRLTLLALALAVSMTSVAGCAIVLNSADRPATPAQVRPTLDSWAAVGMSCTGPTEDNLPSGLLAWDCDGMLEGVEISGVRQGDDQGVAGFQVVARAATEPDRARDALARLVEATPPLDGLEPDTVAFIDSWPGIHATGFFGAARVRVDVDRIWRSLTISTGTRPNLY